MKEIHNTGGRFLVEDQTGDYLAPAPSHTSGTTNSNNDEVDAINPLLLEKVWVEVSDEKAMVKIMHILREKEKKKKHQTIGGVDGKEDDIKNEDMETANSFNLDTNLNATLANQQIGGDLPKRKYTTGEEDEIYERQIREYNRLQRAHLQKQAHDMNQQVPNVAHHPHHQSATSARLQRAHLHEHTHDMNHQVPSVAYQPHHQSATSARLQQAHFQKQTYDMNRQVPSVAHYPHRESATPAYAFSDNRGGSMSPDSLSRAYEQQLREYQRLQEAHSRRMQLQQNIDSRGGVIEMASSHKYEGQKIPQDNDTIMNTKHSRFDPQAQAQHWRTSFANPTELGVPVKPYGLQKYEGQKIPQDNDAIMNTKSRFDPQAQAQDWHMFANPPELGVPVKQYGLQKSEGQKIPRDNYASMNVEPSKFDPRARAQDWHMSLANPTELGVPVNPYGPPQAVKPYDSLYDRKLSFDPANKLRKREKEKGQGLEDGENSIKTMEVDNDEMEAASTLLLLGLK